MTEETTEETLSQSGDIITQKTKTYTLFPHYNSWIRRFFIRIRLISNKKELNIRAINVGNMYRISSKLILIPDDIASQDVREALFKTNALHSDKIVYIIACAIQNDENEPSKALIKFLTYHLDYNVIPDILDIIFTQIHAKGFMKSIILLKGLNVISVPEKDA